MPSQAQFAEVWACWTAKMDINNLRTENIHPNIFTVGGIKKLKGNL